MKLTKMKSQLDNYSVHLSTLLHRESWLAGVRCGILMRKLDWKICRIVCVKVCVEY